MAGSPDYVAYHVREAKDDKKAFWRAIGAAWTNKDGSLSIVLDALPVDGRLQLRAPTAKESTDES